MIIRIKVIAGAKRNSVVVDSSEFSSFLDDFMCKKNSFGENSLKISLFDAKILEESTIRVYVTARAIDGKANKAVVKLLATQFGVRKSCIDITKGLKSQYKTVSISSQ